MQNISPCCGGLGDGARSSEVRLPEQLEGLDGLIIPGGESTTIGKLAVALWPDGAAARSLAQQKAIWGTCAGAIFLSKDAHRHQPLLGLMDITVERNAFGRQVDSFEIDLDVPALQRGRSGRAYLTMPSSSVPR